MGGKSWQLEVFKMGLYMAFPVGCFYFFNQPELFQKLGNIKSQVDAAAHLDTTDDIEDRKTLRELRLSRAMKREAKWREEIAAKKNG